MRVATFYELTGILFWSGATFLSGLAGSFQFLLAARALVGIGEAAYTPAGVAVLSALFPKDVQAHIQGSCDIGMFDGGATGIALGGMMTQSFCWPAVFEGESLICGLDVGSTTCKYTLASPRGEVLAQAYERHNTRQAEKILQFLTMLESKHGLTPGRDHVFFTGSGAGIIAPLVGGKVVQEVVAVAAAVDKLHPNVRFVSEIGGEDMKTIFFQGEGISRSKQVLMQSACSGGTGTFIEKRLLASSRFRPRHFPRWAMRDIRCTRSAASAASSRKPMPTRC